MKFFLIFSLFLIMFNLFNFQDPQQSECIKECELEISNCKKAVYQHWDDGYLTESQKQKCFKIIKTNYKEKYSEKINIIK